MFAQRDPGFSGVNKVDVYSSYEELRGKWSGVHPGPLAGRSVRHLHGVALGSALVASISQPSERMEESPGK